MEPHILNIEDKQKVSYCIPLWLRDEQVKQSIQRVSGRIQKAYEKRVDPVAVVCFGPSLNDTWEQIKDFKFVISCSGAHKFLVERGIIPNWHVEVDPRSHKTALIGPPQKETEYLIASTCHMDVFNHLEGFDVKLWHVFSGDDYAHRTLPHGEWALTGGSSVGLRALTIARFLGFCDLHVFGMDGCEGASGKHAAEHPNQPKNYALTEYKGIQYRTTSSMLHCAVETWHELDQLPDVTAKFYGEGLVQAMAKDYVRTIMPAVPRVAFQKPELISAEYRKLNAQLHQSNLAYGVGGGKHAKTVLRLAEVLKTHSILDYGCGKGYLAREIPFPIWEYDPAVPGKDESPRQADLLVCTDVLEHIEPDHLTIVLDDMRRCLRKLGYFTIHTGPAQKTLPDGRNTHLIQKDAAWWRTKLSKFFQVGDIKKSGPELHVIVVPKPPKQKQKLVQQPEEQHV